MDTRARELAFRYQLERAALVAARQKKRWREMADGAESEEKALRARSTAKVLGPLPRARSARLSLQINARVSAGKVQQDLPFYAALHLRELSPPAWARQQRRPRVSVETVRNWLKAPGRGGRKIPEFWAKRIAAEFVDRSGHSMVPAVDASWPSGIRRLSATLPSAQAAR